LQKRRGKWEDGRTKAAERSADKERGSGRNRGAGYKLRHKRLLKMPQENQSKGGDGAQRRGETWAEKN